MGTGTIATEHIVAAIRTVGHEVHWVVSRNRNYAKYFSEDMRIPKTSVEARQALGDPQVDFVYVSAARDRRKHYIATAAAAGKHILCDGPISSSSRVAGALVQKCKEAGISLTLNQPSRASTIHQTMRRLLIEGEIGTLQSLLIVRGAPFQSPPNRRNEDEEKEGNILLDFSAESIDLARFLTGQEPIDVSALETAPSDTSQQISYAVRMSGGVLFQAYESFATAEIESVVMLAGSHGALIAHGTLNGKTSGTLIRRTNARNELIPVRERDQHFTTIEGFLASVRQPSTWMCQGDDCVTALRTAEAIKSAGGKRRTIVI
ncbi:Gfo/Idh/MocA family oxidoreductase [Sinorhizobium sp. BG8]|uniref:Gfo/Idh/MocA family protein n=1 Tax=Sinorhizobium sp. BG8 TaxID=2613773 RepID=UPI00193DE9F7|nr:Gfo/Idh/MocA family oxidoreductase [Sinorhizobium sp. BG8]QRM56424.1 Gfo/Idh/MocA family oxidoreductase [Sinorhizobium sp. BG8]